MMRLDLLSINLGGTKKELGISLKLLCQKSPSVQLSDGLRAAAMTGCCLTSCPLWHQYCQQDSFIRGCKKQPRQKFAAASPIIKCKVKALPQRFKLSCTAALPTPALPAGCCLTCRMTWFNQCHLEALKRPTNLKRWITSGMALMNYEHTTHCCPAHRCTVCRLLAAVFMATAMPPMPGAASAKFCGCPPISNSTGGDTKTMFCAGHCCTNASYPRLPQIFRGCKEQLRLRQVSFTHIKPL